MENRMPELKDVKQVCDGWVKKYILTYELPDGEIYQYESVSRKSLDAYKTALLSNARGEGGKPENADAVCIVPILPDGSFLLIREFRYAVNAWVIAFPAGLVEPGETLRACVDRELSEETGYRVRDDGEGASLVALPQSGYSSVGMGEENVHVVIAKVEPHSSPDLQHGELIESFILARENVGSFLETNRDLIGTRCQLLLEAARGKNALQI